VNMSLNEVFTNTEFNYKKGEELLACADGLLGWAFCMSGNQPPETFGSGMVKISTFLGISANPDSLSDYADKILDKKE